MRIRVRLRERPVERGHALDVGVEGLVDRWVERDRRRAVNDDVEIAGQREGVVQDRPR